MPLQLSTRDVDFERRFAAFLADKREVAEEVDTTVREIIADVRLRGDTALAAHAERMAGLSPAPRWRMLPGPTGEANLFAALPRDAVLCLAEHDTDRLLQLAAVLAVGSRAVWPSTAAWLCAKLPEEVRERIALAQDWTSPGVSIDAAIHHGSTDALLALQATLADRPGPIVGIAALRPGDGAIPLERLVVERALSVNTAAAGGNASLMTIG